MVSEHYIIATAGHVDHGKSALVRALTGTDPDRLPEERARGLTIDLGFASLKLQSPKDQATTYLAGIVDVPGHQDFVKNMVAGVGSVDLALIIVAANDGWMPQSEEHLQILTYLGVQHAVIALTKVDLAEADSKKISAYLRNRLAHSPFADSPIVPTSTVTGEGIEELRSTIASTLSRVPPTRDTGKPRLPVDRVFQLRGIGTVVTGTLIGGRLRRGDSVIIEPREKTARIRSIQSHYDEVEASCPGSRTALNLPRVTGGSGDSPHDIRRGDVITLAELGGPTVTVDTILEKSSRLKEAGKAAAKPLLERARVRLHHACSNTPARIVFLETGLLRPGQRAIARLHLESPLFAFVGDRFVIRDWSGQKTLAGGCILDTSVEPTSKMEGRQATFLAACARNPGQAAARLDALLRRESAIPRSGLFLQSHFSDRQVAEAVTSIQASGKALVLSDLLIEASWWKSLIGEAGRVIEAEHREHPERVGLTLSRLRKTLGGFLDLPTEFEALIEELPRHGYRKSGIFLHRIGYRPALPPHLEAAANRIRTALKAGELDPPSRKLLAGDREGESALRFLLRAGEVVQLAESVVISKEAHNLAQRRVVEYLRRCRRATVSEIRLELGTSRRVAVPLLEKFDRAGLTVRQGDHRILR